jgi:hypothetical protein
MRNLHEVEREKSRRTEAVLKSVHCVHTVVNLVRQDVEREREWAKEAGVSEMTRRDMMMILKKESEQINVEVASKKELILLSSLTRTEGRSERRCRPEVRWRKTEQIIECEGVMCKKRCVNSGLPTTPNPSRTLRGEKESLKSENRQFGGADNDEARQDKPPK